MTFLPILERELRMRARSQASYWGRVMVGVAGAVAVDASALETVKHSTALPSEDGL